MTFAPSLTWMHLLPAGVRYRCDASVPAWFRDLIRPADVAGRPAEVRIAFGAWDDDLLSAAVDGVVAVNCRGLTDERLHAAGFGYVRRFAALPNITAARWFIPLDLPAVAAAAFGVYSPTRLERADQADGGQASHGPGGAARVVPGQRVRSPSGSRRRWSGSWRTGLGTGDELRLALSAGAPEPARNRKASAARGPAWTGRSIGFAKLAGSRRWRRSCCGRRRPTLTALAAKPAVADAVPKLLAAGEAEGRYLPGPKPGRTGGPRRQG